MRRSPGALRSDINSRWPSRHLTKPPLRAMDTSFGRHLARWPPSASSPRPDNCEETEKPSFHVMYQAHTQLAPTADEISFVRRWRIFTVFCPITSSSSHCVSAHCAILPWPVKESKREGDIRRGRGGTRAGAVSRAARDMFQPRI